MKWDFNKFLKMPINKKNLRERKMTKDGVHVQTCPVSSAEASPRSVALLRTRRCCKLHRWSVINK